jgi:hypothetical protein
MSLEWDVDEENGLVRLTARGRVGLRDVAEALGRMQSGPRFEAGLLLLADLREMAYAPSPEDLRRLKELKGEIATRARRVALVATGAANLGLARLLCAYARAEGMAVEAFADAAPALAWLHRDADRSGGGGSAPGAPRAER